MLFTRSFEAVLDFIQFALLFCSFFTVLGVIKLRITQPDLPRPYRAWGYPVTPVVFLLVTGFMMYYLLTERPLQSVLGILIMISGLLIYAVFRKRADRAPRLHPRAANERCSSSIKIAALAAAVLILGRDAAARAADTVTVDDTARFLAGMHAVGGLAADAADQGSGLAAPRQILRYCVRAARAAPAIEDPRLVGCQSGGAAADHVLHVQRPGLSLRQRVLFEGDDLCAERAGAAGLGARSDEDCRAAASTLRSTMSSIRWRRS